MAGRVLCPIASASSSQERTRALWFQIAAATINSSAPVPVLTT